MTWQAVPGPEWLLPVPPAAPAAVLGGEQSRKRRRLPGDAAPHAVVEGRQWLFAGRLPSAGIDNAALRHDFLLEGPRPFSRHDRRGYLTGARAIAS